MNERHSILGFNHISKSLTSEQCNLLSNLYYHRKMWCYKRFHLTTKRKDLVLTAASAIITTGGLAGTTVFLPAAALGACSIVLGVIANEKNYSYPRKVELLRYAYTSYEKVLHKLRAYLRGEVFEPDVLTRELNILEDNISDLCPPFENEKYERQYVKTFDTSEIEGRITNVAR